MSDLTGGIAESLSLREGGELSEPTTALATLHSLLKMTSIVTSKVHKEASTSNGVSGSDNRKEDSTTAPEILSNGIIVGDTYRIYSLHKVRYKLKIMLGRTMVAYFAYIFAFHIVLVSNQVSKLRTIFDLRRLS